jgi:hypothetical protein
VALQSLKDLGRLTCRRFLELFRHMVGLLGRVINPSQGLYLHRTTQHRKTRTNILERDSNPRSQQPTGQDPRLRPHGHCDRCYIFYFHNICWIAVCITSCSVRNITSQVCSCIRKSSIQNKAKGEIKFISFSIILIQNIHEISEYYRLQAYFLCEPDVYVIMILIVITKK